MTHLFTCGLGGENQKITEIGLVPQTWEVVPLASVAKVGNGSTPRRSRLDYWQGGTIPWLNSAKVYDRIITKGADAVTPTAVAECHLPTVPMGSLVVAITGQGKTLGHVARLGIASTVSQHLAYIAFTDQSVVPDLVRYFLESRYDDLRQIGSSGGTTKGAITCGELKRFRVPVPAPKEQEQIVAHLSALDQAVLLAAGKLDRLRELFSAILEGLMTEAIPVSTLGTPSELGVAGVP